MSTTCSIVNCNNRGGRDKKRFFRIPKVITSQGEAAEKKSERRRRAGIAAINRSDVTCYEQLRIGKPHQYGELPPDWAPSKHLSYEGTKSPSKAAARHKRLQNRKESAKKTKAALRLLELSAYMEDESDRDLAEPISESPTVEEEPAVTERFTLANQEIHELKQKNKQLKEQNECLKNIVHKMKANSPADFEGDNDKVKYYTELPSFVTLMALVNLLSPEMTENRNSLSKFQKIIITLMSLKHNLPITDLSYRFGVSKATISKASIDTLNLIYAALQPLVRWPELDELRETMPMVFRKYFERRVTCVIDCFEIFTDRPSNMTARAQTWSNYKHLNTAKYLIGITPQGSVSFISEGWGGRVSDKHLTANCKFSDNLMHGDLIIADRGFDIQEVVALVETEVKFPSFTRGKQQLSALKVETTRKIANVRIHVERVIGTVRQKFMILGATSPIDYLIPKPGDKCAVLDKIVFVCCALTNMCPSVVPFD